MDRYDPNEWTSEFVSNNQDFCIQVLRDSTSTVIDLVRNGQYEASVSGLDRILNGLITLQNHTDIDYSSHICFLSWMEAEIIAFGVDAPEEKRRATALKLFEDAYDFSQSEKTKSILSPIISDLQVGIPHDTIREKHDPKFPATVVDILTNLNSKFVPGTPAPRSSSSSIRSNSTRTPEPSRSRKSILIPLLSIICIVCLGLFLWWSVAQPKESASSEPPSTSGSTEPSITDPIQTEPTETTSTSEGGDASYEVRIVKTQTGSGLNLRAEPGTDAEILTSIPDRSTVTLLNTEENWAYVSFEDLTGWVSMDYLVTEDDPSLTEPAGSTGTATVKTKGAELRLRDEPSLSAEVIDGIPNGAAVTVISQDGEWSYVDYEGTLGWCSSEYLVFE